MQSIILIAFMAAPSTPNCMYFLCVFPCVGYLNKAIDIPLIHEYLQRPHHTLEELMVWLPNVNIWKVFLAEHDRGMEIKYMDITTKLK